MCPEGTGRPKLRPMSTRPGSPLYCGRSAPARGVCRTSQPAEVLSLLRFVHQLGAYIRAAYPSQTSLSSGHSTAARVLVGALSLAVVVAASQHGTLQAQPIQAATQSKSILPANVGIGVRTTEAIRIVFDRPMDHQSVESTLTVRPATRHAVAWSDAGRVLTVSPTRRWLTDARYVAGVAASARDTSGRILGTPKRVSFTTQTAPVVTSFQLRFPQDLEVQRNRALAATGLTAPVGVDGSTATDATGEVSTRTTVTIGFSSPMSHRDTERHFLISPHVKGDLGWEGNSLVFTPARRLATLSRYAITVIGAHDALGNRIDGDVSFSFTTRIGAQVVKMSPANGSINVTDGRVGVWFTQPMDTAATTSALKVTDLTTGAAVAGTTTWNADGSQLSFAPAGTLAAGHRIEVRLGDGARDGDLNPIATAWTFTTKPPAAPTVRTPVAGPPPPADLASYALWQINQSRARYGFSPLRLDAAVSAVASAHAWDMANRGYFSHSGRDGSNVSDRLRRGGVSFSYSGENICYYNGIGTKAMLNWCHGVFMSEPYPGVANHIGNILSPHYTRLGVGIAHNGSRTYITWDFAG